MLSATSELSLCSNQEKADTKMFLCGQHATQPDENVINASPLLPMMLQSWLSITKSECDVI